VTSLAGGHPANLNLLLVTYGVSGKNPLHGWRPAGPEEASNVQMKQQAEVKTHQVPNEITREFNQFQHVICKTADHFLSNHPLKDFTIPEPDMDKLFISWLNSDFDKWRKRLNDAQQTADKFYRNPTTYWRTLALAVSPPEIQKEVTNIPPTIDREKYIPTGKVREPPPQIVPGIGTGFNLKISMSMTKAWRLDPRWEKLLPSAKTLFYYLIFRTYRKDTFQKIKKALSKGESYFPWCLTGIKSLEKVLTYHKGSSTRLRHYEACQIKKALRQLWDLGLVHRIFRGLPDQGAGKYHVFLKPIMAARFNKSSIDRKKGMPTRKRHSRMT
jgi:hypothetical protein